MYRFDEAAAARQRLESDNQELRRLLHEERNADPAAGLESLGLNGVTDVMEAKERLGQLAARYGQEKRRNAELIHRLKSLHESHAGAEQLKGRHLELQEAHAEMSRYLQKCEREAARVSKCRATIEMQEGVTRASKGCWNKPRWTSGGWPRRRRSLRACRTQTRFSRAGRTGRS